MFISNKFKQKLFTSQNLNLMNGNIPLKIIGKSFELSLGIKDIFSESKNKNICQKCKKNPIFLSFDICKECLNKEIYNNSISLYKFCIKNKKIFHIENVSIKLINRQFKLIQIYNYLDLGININEYEKIIKGNIMLIVE